MRDSERRAGHARLRREEERRDELLEQAGRALGELDDGALQALAELLDPLRESERDLNVKRLLEAVRACLATEKPLAGGS